MNKLQTETIITAPRSEVWKTLMEQSAYPRWNPFIRSIKGDITEGNTIEVVIQPPEQKAMTFKPEVLVCDPQKEFRWLGKLFIKGLFDGEHYFILEDAGPGQTRLIHGEHFRGILAGLLLKMIGANTLAGFKAMNQALKMEVESNGVSSKKQAHA